jgi:DUF438 domain-containing protein
MSELIKTSQQKASVLGNLLKLVREDGDVGAFYQDNREILKQITPFDVFALPQFQEQSDLKDEEIKKMAGKLVNLFRHGLENYSWNREETQLLRWLFAESSAIKEELGKIKPFLKDLKHDQLKPMFASFSELHKRFLKMENIIQPRLEKKGVNPRPLQIMWSLYNDARSELQALLAKLETKASDLPKALGSFYFLVYGILEKEELLVLPIASRVLSKDEWEEMLLEAGDYGFSFIEVEMQKKKAVTNGQSDFPDLLFSSETGGMTLAELLLIHEKLPLDFTFVDEFNRVKYYNNSPSRLFPRSPSVIGRMVSKCHPPKSVHVVEEIIEHFRKGIKNEAKFWLEVQGRFIFITYYALRDHSGQYRGVLEVTQDVTEIRHLSGEQRLLKWND